METLGGREIHYFGNRDAKTVLIQMADDHDLEFMEQEMAHLGRLCGGALKSGNQKESRFLIAAAGCSRWNDELSPWPASAVYGDEGFGDGAEETLSFLLDTLIPELDKEKAGRVYYLGGYSLAGLFALWAATKTDRFAGVAAASPSVWFPEFVSYIKEHPPKTPLIYLSLGTKEEKTRNPVMAKVGDAIREISEDLKSKDYTCTLEWNPGNHFKEPDLRMAKGFAWVMDQKVIRHSTEEDLPRIMEIYACARKFMAEHGNPNQWGPTNWPPEALIRRDIATGKNYVCVKGGTVVGTFFFTVGENAEPGYLRIEDGDWKKDGPYGVVHRIASDGTVKGVGAFCINWAYDKCGHLRIDTHGDNKVMQNLVKKLGFVHCGTIYVEEDNYPRLAFEKYGD